MSDPNSTPKEPDAGAEQTPTTPETPTAAEQAPAQTETQAVTAPAPAAADKAPVNPNANVARAKIRELLKGVFKLSKRLDEIHIQRIGDLEKAMVRGMMDLFGTNVGGILRVTDIDGQRAFELGEIIMPHPSKISDETEMELGSLLALKQGRPFAEADCIDYLRHGFGFKNRQTENKTPRATPGKGVGVDVWIPFYDDSGKTSAVLFFDQTDKEKYHHVPQQADLIFAAVEKFLNKIYRDAVEMIDYRVRTQETLRGKSDEINVVKDKQEALKAEQEALKAEHDAAIETLAAGQDTLKAEHDALVETLVAEQEAVVKALKAEIAALKVA